MKSLIIAGSLFCVFIITGTLVSIFTVPVEYHYGEAKGYIDGAAPSQIEPWEMY